MTALLYIFAGIGLLSVILTIFLIAGANILRRSGNETIPYYLHGLIGPEPRCDIGCAVADRRAAIHDATMGIPTTSPTPASPFPHVCSDRCVGETPMDKGKPELERPSEPHREGASGGVCDYHKLAATEAAILNYDPLCGSGPFFSNRETTDSIDQLRARHDAERADRRAKAYSVGVDAADESQAYGGRTVVSISKTRAGGGVVRPDDEGNKG